MYSPCAAGGLWINHTVAEALNRNDAVDMRNGFNTELFNSRGAYLVDPSGKPELELSKKYKEQAEAVENAGYYRLASTLRQLANSYANGAKQIIDQAQEELNN
jgi:hypothetical protein